MSGRRRVARTEPGGLGDPLQHPGARTVRVVLPEPLGLRAVGVRTRLASSPWLGSAARNRARKQWSAAQGEVGQRFADTPWA